MASTAADAAAGESRSRISSFGGGIEAASSGSGAETENEGSSPVPAAQDMPETPYLGGTSSTSMSMPRAPQGPHVNDTSAATRDFPSEPEWVTFEDYIEVQKHCSMLEADNQVQMSGCASSDRPLTASRSLIPGTSRAVTRTCMKP